MTLDLCFTCDEKVMNQIREQVRPAIDELIFHASHTHSGPTYSEVPDALQHAAPRMVTAIKSAVSSMTAARIRTGWGETYLGFNRLYVEMDGTVRMFWRNEPKMSTRFLWILQ